jgi:hypothetical protein
MQDIEREFSHALERMEGDVDLLISTARIVAEDADIELTRLNDALNRGDVANTRAAAHILRGMLSTFEPDKADNGLKAIEEAVDAADWDAATLAFSRVRKNLQSLITRIRLLSVTESKGAAHPA